MADSIEWFELNTGANIPSVGLGTYDAISPPHVIADAVTCAVKVGYRHIDCADLYLNQKEIGIALKLLFEEGVVKREDLFITSKLWNANHAPEDVPEALEKTLDDLQLDYIDLYLIHWPVSIKKGVMEVHPEDLTQPCIPSTWKAMEALYDSGKARAIGVSNFSMKKLEDLLSVARIPPAVNQVECHPVWQQPKLHAFCKSRNIHISGYSPLGAPGSRHEKTNVLNNEILKMVAENLGKSPAQVALRWGLQQGHSVLPKTINEMRMIENLDILDWSIPDEFIAKISEIKQERQVTGHEFVDEVYGAYRTLEDLWDGEM